ncbi:DUF6065 family protein [Starkeya koreensis]|uniref:DUF6065 family protein n=1 Tax=Ancylobacter koreensis TaxID=266121 RepID=A0ABT0DLD6_9HYPH|nr:DUF6065 family protein [Ancylobacter koreensis]
MKLVAYAIGDGVEIVTVSPERAWMDGARDRSPYSCLPLAIADTHGWELRNPVNFSAMWGGGAGIDDIVVMPDGEGIARSHFGEGVLTFLVPFVFRTPPEMDLIFQGRSTGRRTPSRRRPAWSRATGFPTPHHELEIHPGAHGGTLRRRGAVLPHLSRSPGRCGGNAAGNPPARRRCRSRAPLARVEHIARPVPGRPRRAGLGGGKRGLAEALSAWARSRRPGSARLPSHAGTAKALPQSVTLARHNPRKA